MLLSRLAEDTGHEVRAVGTGTEGLAAALTEDFDLILLELSLPDVAGEHVLSALMTVKPSSRVMVVSSVTDIHRRVAVLDSGAIDFVAKPFANDELLARIRARIRGERSAQLRLAPAVNTVGSDDAEPAESSGNTRLLTRRPETERAERHTMSDQAIQLDSHRRALVVKGKVIDLSQREFVLMSHLLQRRGQICTRQELLADVWGVDFDPGTNVVDVYVRRLRMKLSDHSIETVRNHGYRLIAS
ncbi:response regulator transcription factor [soil metagenome]